MWQIVNTLFDDPFELGVVGLKWHRKNGFSSSCYCLTTIMLNTIPYPTVENIYGIQISDLANNGQIKGIKY